MMVKLTFQLVILVVLISQIHAQSDMEKVKKAIKKADLDFSDYSKANGFKEAFFKFMTEDVVILKDNSYPIEGGDKIRELFANDGGYTLTWYPTFADVSSAGDIGYTYGLYELIVTDEKGITSTNKGTYLTIWKLQKNGDWKFVFDTGHKGLEPPKK